MYNNHSKLKSEQVNRDWDSRVINGQELLKSYDSNNDPYNLLAAEKMRRQQIKLVDKVKSSQNHLSQSQKLMKYKGSQEFPSSMKEMHRPLSAGKEKFPKHQVPNASTFATGLTFSAELKGDTAEGLAELEVLKSIINREGYLARLYNITRTVGKKFDGAVADMLDFVRAASLDAIEKIVIWREAKKDHDAAFMWNGVNYLIKMPSDLDYLSGYLAVKRWMGFGLERNPFCIPFPMELGVQMFSESVMDPKHLEAGGSVDGFAIGGLSHKRLKKQYAPVPIKQDTAIGITSNTERASSPPSRNSKMSPYGLAAGTLIFLILNILIFTLLLCCYNTDSLIKPFYVRINYSQSRGSKIRER